MSSKSVSGSAQYSTALSDGVLAAVTAIMAWKTLMSGCLYAACGLLVVTSAACFGVVRFSQASPSNTLISRHRYLSWLSQSLGLPCITASFFGYHMSSAAHFMVVLAVANVLLQERVLPSKLCATVGEIFGGVATVSLFAFGCIHLNGYAVVGTALYAIAGVVIKTEGYIGGLLRVDVFHYVLVVANIALMKGLVMYDLPPIFYNPS